MKLASKVWLITGASKGFGYELTKFCLEQGHKVAAASRNVKALRELQNEYPDNLLSIPLQVVDELDCRKKVELVWEHFGHIDVLVNNAGYGLFGTMEELSNEEIKDMYEVNVFGVINMSRAVLPKFREAKSGCILNIASVAGSFTVPSLGLYSSTKAAVIQFTEALKMEVEEFGIEVCAVCPGGFRTDFLDDSSMRAPKRPIEDYTTVRNNMERYASLNHQQGGDPLKFAPFIFELLALEKLPPRIYVGSDALRTMNRRLNEIGTSIEEHRDLSESTDVDAEN